MPVLDPTADLALISIGGEYSSRLPPPGVSGNMNPLFAALTHADFGATHLDDAMRLGAMIDRSVAISTGWPAQEIEALGELIDAALSQVDPGKMGQALENLGELAALFGELQASLANALAGVPILGWIVRVGMIVWDLVQLARLREPQMTGQHPLAYDKDADAYVADRILARAAGRDWTDMFSPQGAAFKLEDLAYTNAGAADGFAWGQLHQGDATQLGLVPGVGAIAGYWQSPRKAPGSTRDPNVVNVVANNQLLPSAVSLSGLLWTANQAPGPMLARIDLHALAQRWDAYGTELQAFADSRDGVVKKQINNGWRWLDEHFGAPLYGVTKSDVPAEYRGWGLQNLIAWRLQLAQQRVRDNMNTIAVAYVPPDAPGLTDKATKSAWSESRWRLLAHDARRYVDASIIPDNDYREAMIAAQKTAASGFAVATEGGADKSPKWGASAALLGKPLDPPILPLPPGPPPGPEGATGDSPTTSGAGVGLAVVSVLLLWALARK